FRAGADVRELVWLRTQLVDTVLTGLWQRIDWPADTPACLVAVGGYGRGELHPHSDIDLLILIDRHTPAMNPLLENLVTLFWDTGLHIGHSVRTVADCVTAARDDITVATNLMESRCLTG